MKKRLIAPMAASVATLLPSCLLKAQDAKPNVIFIFADDMTYEGAHGLGNPELKTPNIDRLIAGGTTFVNTFNMGGWGGAISVSSRSMLITGRYLWNSKALADSKYRAPDEARELWPQKMKDAGYQTWMTGKWHIDCVTPQQLFDQTKDVRPGGCPPTTEAQYFRPKSRDDNSWQPWDTSFGGYWSGGRHWTEVQTDDVVNYIESHKDSKTPFFMYCAFNAPHDPRQSPREFVDMYDVDQIALPVNFQPEHPLKELMGCPMSMRDEKMAPFPRTEYAVKKNRQEYYAIISHFDYHLGRILDEIEKSGIAKNTIIILAADNGLSCGQHGLMGKQNMYDHSVRVPLVFCGKGIPKGEKRYCLNYMQDLVPTVYELAGIEKPQDMQFRSLVPVLKNPKAERLPYVYGAFTASDQRMVRNKDYKLFFIPKANTIYLFDMKKDPYETNNLAGDPKYAPVIKALAKEYAVLAREAGDKLDMRKYYPDLF